MSNDGLRNKIYCIEFGSLEIVNQYAVDAEQM